MRRAAISCPCSLQVQQFLGCARHPAAMMGKAAQTLFPSPPHHRLAALVTASHRSTWRRALSGHPAGSPESSLSWPKRVFWSDVVLRDGYIIRRVELHQPGAAYGGLQQPLDDQRCASPLKPRPPCPRTHPYAHTDARSYHVLVCRPPPGTSSISTTTTPVTF